MYNTSSAYCIYFRHTSLLSYVTYKMKWQDSLYRKFVNILVQKFSILGRASNIYKTSTIHLATWKPLIINVYNLPTLTGMKLLWILGINNFLDYGSKWILSKRLLHHFGAWYPCYCFSQLETIYLQRIPVVLSAKMYEWLQL